MLRLSKKSAFPGVLVTALTLANVSSVLADPTSDVLDRLANAMGGVESLQNAHNQLVVASLTGYAPLQAPTPGGQPETFDNIEYTLTRALDGDRYQTQWQLDIDFPLQNQYHFSEIINGDHGAVLGVDSILRLPQAPMQAIRLAARKVQNLVTSPVELVKMMLAAPQDVVLHGSVDSRRKDVTVLGLKKYDKDILLWVDNSNSLPSKATYWDSNPSYGDTQIVTRFSQWQQADGIMVPMTIEQSYRGGEPLGRLERQAVNFNVAFVQDPFDVPAELTVPLDIKRYHMGLKYSNWFIRYTMTGIPFDLNQYTPESVFLQPVGSGVFQLRSFTHNSFIVEMADYLILFDPVLLEERTQLVLPVIKQQWPDKKIKYIVPSHFHVDHSGGVRGYVADGAALVTTQSDKKFYKDVLKSKHIIYPDLLSLFHHRARMVEIDDDFSFDDGSRRVQLLQIDNRHAPGLIVPYIEDEKMIFVSDLYNPELFPTPLPAQFSFWGLDLYNDLLLRNLDIQTIVGAHGGVSSYQAFIDAIEATFPGVP